MEQIFNARIPAASAESLPYIHSHRIHECRREDLLTAVRKNDTNAQIIRVMKRPRVLSCSMAAHETCSELQLESDKSMYHHQLSLTSS